jgi:hypothetical protein
VGRLTTYAIAGFLALILTIGAAPPAGTQEHNMAASTSAKPAIVVDSTGAEVGPLLNTGGVDTALVKADDHTFALQVSSKGFVATGVTFSYTTLACDGAKYVLSAPSSLYISYPPSENASGVQGNYNGGVTGTTLYYPKPKTSVSVMVNSIAVVSSDGKSQVCYPLTATKSTVSQVATLDLSTLVFVPPFKLSY